jgi:hypothetical protein
MIVSDVIHGRISRIELRCADGDRFSENLVPKSEAFLCETSGGDHLLRIADQAVDGYRQGVS